ncbi:MAG: flagellar filament capping protein FliD [Planctomycetaceae bacterium]|nr:flagellar filament capping protein FliD [Planctomycetales bacterium]MCB9925994.1 flagellar filament capping protein FliD [Planctomycetaceae bacterium]
MASIQSSVGLITGIPIQDTVEQLIALSAKPRDLLVDRTSKLQAEQTGIAQLTASVIGVQLSIQGLRNSSIFGTKTVTSSNTGLITATSSGSPAVGTHSITPIRRAQAHQLLSSGFASKTDPLGAGEITFGFGGFVDQSVSLDRLNAGAGVERGKIRITDRTGTTETIDLRFATTIDDVVDAINAASDINVTASTDGDRIKLTDSTSAGQVTANLRVRNEGLTTTATGLGLDGIDTAAAEATGNDILQLYDGLELSQLNDGNGVRFKQGVPDLQVNLQDGTTLDIEFFAQIKGETQSSATTKATNGADAEITFTSVGAGSSFDGYSVVFVDDANVTAGSETVEVDTVSKKITFKIDEGKSRAVHIIAALNNDTTANQYFTAATSAEGDGTEFVTVADKATTTGGAIAYNNESTIGAVLETINAVDPSKLKARISASGDNIELVDLTSGGGTLTVSEVLSGSTADDLGLTTTANAGVLTGKRRFGGLNSVLLDSLGGGYGLGTLGTLDLTDRSGATASVDLSSAETLQDVITAINSAGIGITAKVNSARNGLQINDNTGGANDLIIANGDATNTADRLRIATNSDVTKANSGALDLQTINKNTKLASFNGGSGVDDGSFLITDSTGGTGAVNLSLLEADDIGDIIDAINALSIGVEARINDAGDGILLLDTAGGSGDLTVADVGSGTSAADLKIAGTSASQAIDGSTTLKVTLDSDDTLEDLVAKINALDADIAASTFNSGSGATPFRLSLSSLRTGKAGELRVDASALDISFQQTVAAQDALVVVGSADSNAVGALATSSTNDFDDLIEGVKLNIAGTSQEAVTVTVQKSSNSIKTQLRLFTEQYNKLQSKIDELAFFDENENSVGVLFGSSEILRIQNDLSNVLTGRFSGAGPIASLAELGLRLNDSGELSFDEAKFDNRYAEDSGDIERFFTQASTGAAHKLFNTLERLAGVGNSVLVSRSAALQTTIESNTERVNALNDALDKERERLLETFYRLEETIGKLQNNLSALAQIQAIPPLTSTNSS